MAGTLELPDGREFNVLSNEGASEFFVAEPKFISTLLGEALMRGRSDQARINAYALIAAMGSSLQLATVDEAEYRRLVTFVKAHIAKISRSTQCRTTGTMIVSDQFVFTGIVPTWSRQPLFVKHMLESGGLEALANLVARDEEGKPTIPSPHIAFGILVTTFGVLVAGDKNRELHITSLPKNMRMEIERKGLTAQALRCLTVPIPGGGAELYVGAILDNIERDSKLLKKFAPGTQSGDILEGLLKGTDGWTGEHPERQMVVSRLATLQKLATMVTDRTFGCACRHCNKGESQLAEPNQRLLTCGKCRGAYYCSRECQVADWRNHKKQCGKTGKARPSVENMTSAFIHENYVAIMTKVKETCVTQLVDKKDVIVAVDFYKEEGHSISPAMEGQFQVVSFLKCLDGDPSTQVTWLNEDTPENVLDQHKRMTSNHLLFIVRFIDGGCAALRVTRECQSTGFRDFSDKALELFPQNTAEKKTRLLMLRGPANDEEKPMFEEMRQALRDMDSS